MKRRFFNILIRNVWVGGILTVFAINSDKIWADHSASWATSSDYRIRTMTILLVIFLYGALGLVMRWGIKVKVELTNKPYWSRYLGWPQHSSLLSAMLTVLILIYLGRTNSAHPAVYLHSLLIFTGIYLALAVVSWVWIKHISKKKYQPKKAVYDDDLIRSYETHQMIRACICQKKLAGYIPLTKFLLAGQWVFVFMFLLAILAFVFSDEVEGKLITVSVIIFIFLFYFIQTVARLVKYLEEGHSLGCALRRAYCESI